MDWGAKEFVIGKPTSRIPLNTEKHLGETNDLDGYTTDSLDLEDSDFIASYFINYFLDQTKGDYDFPDVILEYPDKPKTSVMEDRSLGESNVSLTAKWICRHLMEENLPRAGTSSGQV